MINRLLSQCLKKTRKSILLLGPRQTGKSTLISTLNPSLSINLAQETTYLDFAKNPAELEQRISALNASQPVTVFIDEVQRLPSLLNTIQFILDQSGSKIQFLLTGSSARKLRRGNANLLPGRIHTYYLGTIVAGELSHKMDFRQALAYGSLPGIWTEEDVADRQKTLSSYAGTYLKEEVQAENLTRNLEGFSRFLAVAAEWSGHFLDLTKISTSAQISRQSAARYFEILEDCLIVHRTMSFSKSITRRLIQHPKFYFFDTGVLNGLLGNFQASQDRIGNLFEHFIFNQLKHSASALDKDIKISSFRTEHGAEVDFIVEIDGRIYALELKASQNVGQADLRGLKRFTDFYPKKVRQIVLYLGQHRKKIEDVDILPWQDALQELGF